MKRTDTIVIGGGQAGLAMSRCLSERGIEHLVLERGRVAERWRRERWDSLRLLTPNWQSRLPGFRYDGPDPDGYMTASELVGYLERYARSFAPPLLTGTTVERVEPCSFGYRVTTDRGAWEAANVVIATGPCDTPRVPPAAGRLAARVHQTVPSRYKRPEELPPGGVLVVGASASGVQLAEEIHASGRPVTLAVGRHTRMPRTYRGADIMFWLDAMGTLDETAAEAHDLEAARRQPSMQLVGRPDRRTLDLAALERRGIRLVGRVLDAEGERLTFAGDLAETCAHADAKLARLLERIDTFVARVGLGEQVDGPERPAGFQPAPAPRGLDLRREGIASVLWATGFTRRYPWLAVPVLDARGEILHDGGLTAAPGLYVLGLRFLRRRKSSFLDGVGDDAGALADHLAKRLRRSAA